jgi:hypothetical protein
MPCVRFARNVELTDEGRARTALLSPALALETATQLPLLSAADTWSSRLFRLLAWSFESRPEPPPQATRNETAKPSPPASSALGP